MKPETKTRVIVTLSSAVLGLSTLPSCERNSSDADRWDTGKQYSWQDQRGSSNSDRPDHNPDIRRYPSRELIDQIKKADSLSSPTPTPRPSRTPTIY